MLEIVFDRMIQLLSTSLRKFFQDNVEVSFDTITSVRFGGYFNTVPLPMLLGVFKADEEAMRQTVGDLIVATATAERAITGPRGAH